MTEFEEIIEKREEMKEPFHRKGIISVIYKRLIEDEKQRKPFKEVRRGDIH